MYADYTWLSHVAVIYVIFLSVGNCKSGSNFCIQWNYIFWCFIATKHSSCWTVSYVPIKMIFGYVFIILVEKIRFWIKRVLGGKKDTFVLWKWSKTAYNLKCKYLVLFLQKEVGLCLHIQITRLIYSFGNFYPSSKHSLTAQLVNKLDVVSGAAVILN